MDGADTTLQRLRTILEGILALRGLGWRFSALSGVLSAPFHDPRRRVQGYLLGSELRAPALLDNRPVYVVAALLSYLFP